MVQAEAGFFLLAPILEFEASFNFLRPAGTLRWFAGARASLRRWAELSW